MATLTEKQHAHELIDRVPEDQLKEVVRLLEFILLDPKSRDISSIPIETEEISEEEELAVAESLEWRKHHTPISHEEVLAEFGLTMADFERMGLTPLPPEIDNPSR